MPPVIFETVEINVDCSEVGKDAAALYCVVTPNVCPSKEQGRKQPLFDTKPAADNLNLLRTERRTLT
jgi:hypothetical protein